MKLECCAIRSPSVALCCALVRKPLVERPSRHILPAVAQEYEHDGIGAGTHAAAAAHTDSCRALEAFSKSSRNVPQATNPQRVARGSLVTSLPLTGPCGRETPLSRVHVACAACSPLEHSVGICTSRSWSHHAHPTSTTLARLSR